MLQNELVKNVENVLYLTSKHGSRRIAGDMLSGFDIYQIKANPEKVQFILFGKDKISTLTLLPCVRVE